MNTSFLSPRPNRFAGLLAPSLLALGLAGCFETEPPPKDEFTPAPMVFAVTSDYQTGSYSVFGMDSLFDSLDIAPIHSDAQVRYAGGDDIFIINRLGRDNIQVVDRNKLVTVMQIPLPALSNPYDVAVNDGIIYVALFGSARIGVYRQSDGGALPDIDLAAYADTVDGLPETTALRVVGDKLYALAANLDVKHGFKPLQARLIEYDLKQKTFRSLDLPYGNPTNLAYDSSGGKFYIPCRATFLDSTWTPVLDGGIVTVNLSDFTLGASFAMEKDLEGSLNTAIYHKGRLYMDLSAAAGEKIVAIDPADGKAVELGRAEAYKLSGLGIDEAANTLYVGDRKLGLRIFDLETGTEKVGYQVPGGKLPISDLAVIR